VISIGNELVIKGLKCVDESCRHRFNYTADVSSISILHLEESKDVEKTIQLPNGFEYGGNLCNKLVIRPLKWRMMSDPNFGKSLQDSFEIGLMNSVVQIEDMPRGAILTPKDVDRFTPSDIAFVKEAIDGMMYGPRWTVEGQCPSCQESFFFELDWMYESFFGRSFVSPRRRKHSKR